jgi:hypothetical protein
MLVLNVRRDIPFSYLRIMALFPNNRTVHWKEPKDFSVDGEKNSNRTGRI